MTVYRHYLIRHKRHLRQRLFNLKMTYGRMKFSESTTDCFIENGYQKNDIVAQFTLILIYLWLFIMVYKWQA